jgi:hypothetical protein
MNRLFTVVKYLYRVAIIAAYKQVVGHGDRSQDQEQQISWDEDDNAYLDLDLRRREPTDDQ